MYRCMDCGYMNDVTSCTRCPSCTSKRIVWEPSTDEIDDACAYIQAGWTPAERRSRAGKGRIDLRLFGRNRPGVWEERK